MVVLPLAVHGDEASSKNTLQEVKASEILAKIKMGDPVEYSHVIVRGDLDLSKLDLPTKRVNRTLSNQIWGLSETSKIIVSPIKINDSSFDGFVSFSNAFFNEEIDFSDSNFTKDVSFIGATFSGYADLGRAKFYGVADFKGTTFSGFANFVGATFIGYAEFTSAFIGYAQFASATFSMPASFFTTIFGEANFMDITFRRYAQFTSATFSREADFTSATFSEEADFMNANFWELAYFRGAIFNGIANFARSNFYGTANFESIEFSKDAILNEIEFRDITSFDNSQFNEKALFENVIFKSKFSLNKTRYNKLYIRWYNIKDSVIYDDEAYMSLMKNFRDLGYFEDYDGCYFQYRKEHRGQPWPLVNGVDEPILKSIDFLLEWFYGYGTRPINAIYFSIAIIIVFGIFWRAIGLGGPDNVTGEDNDDWERPDDILDILSFSATVFLSGTRLFIDPPDLPRIRGRSRSLVKKSFTVERILGALFSILFFLAISRTVVR
ncbi:Pentapeptide repeats (9 copies) [uncultured archaeon]|nr:Pentapeptide repeats (9 copies) [uncultured archaeon]